MPGMSKGFYWRPANPLLDQAPLGSWLVMSVAQSGPPRQGL